MQDKYILNFDRQIGKYLLAYIKEDNSTKRTKKWKIYNLDATIGLGTIQWYGPWRQYCFWPSYATIFNTQCLEDISKFLKEIKNERNTGKVSI